MSQQLLLLLLLTSAMLAYLISAIECGYGFSTTPYIDTTQYGLPPEGFSRVECKSANYCVYVTATPESFKLASFNLQFCDNEKGFLGRFVPSTLTCERAMQEPEGCTETVLTTSLIPFIPTNVTAEFCCCPKNLCNCNTWNPFSSVYCPPTPATKKSTTVVVTTTNSNPNISTTPIRQTTTIKPTPPTNVSKPLHCGFGYSTTPMKNTSGYGLPPQGFTRVECKSANYCVYVTAPISNSSVSSLNLQFCENEVGFLKEFLKNNISCKEVMQNKDGCANVTVVNSQIPIIPMNLPIPAQLCCCTDDLCNCNTWNIFDSTYCPYQPPTENTTTQRSHSTTPTVTTAISQTSTSTIVMSTPKTTTLKSTGSTTLKPTQPTNTSDHLHCGFGYSTTPFLSDLTDGLPPEGFTRIECKSANYCASVTAKLNSVIIRYLNLKFCDNEIGFLKEFLPNDVSCKEAMQNKDHCYNTTVFNQHIPFNSTMDAKFCCCATNLCNCNIWNPLSSVYCPPNPSDYTTISTTQKPIITTQKPTTTTQKPIITTQKPTTTTQKPTTTTTTSNAPSLNKIISSFLAVFVYFAVR